MMFNFFVSRKFRFIRMCTHYINPTTNSKRFQHSDDPNIRHVMRKDDGTVVVTARRDLEAGEELFNQYRSEEEESMPYHRFFTRYGFVPGIQEPVTNLLKEKSSIFFAQKAEV